MLQDGGRGGRRVDWLQVNEHPKESLVLSQEGMLLTPILVILFLPSPLIDLVIFESPKYVGQINDCSWLIEFDLQILILVAMAIRAVPRGHNEHEIDTYKKTDFLLHAHIVLLVAWLHVSCIHLVTIIIL